MFIAYESHSSQVSQVSGFKFLASDPTNPNKGWYEVSPNYHKIISTRLSTGFYTMLGSSRVDIKSYSSLQDIPNFPKSKTLCKSEVAESGQAIEVTYGDFYSKVSYLPEYEFRFDWMSHNEVRMILTGVEGKKFCVPLTTYYVSTEKLTRAFNSRFYTLFVFRINNVTREDKYFILESGNEDHTKQLTGLLENRDIVMWRAVTLEPCAK